MRPLVILRPEPGASVTAEAARQSGLDPLVIPLFEVRPVEWQAPDTRDFDALLLTSANAVRHGGAKLQGLAALTAHCVGDSTARAAREAGLGVATIGAGGVDALLESLPGGQRLLHLCGVHRRQAASNAHSIHPIEVYESCAVPAPKALRELSGGVIAVHSPRAGDRLRELSGSGDVDPSRFAIAAISSQAAKAAGPGWESVETAAEPTDTALLAIASRLCNNPA